MSEALPTTSALAPKSPDCHGFQDWQGEVLGSPSCWKHWCSHLLHSNVTLGPAQPQRTPQVVQGTGSGPPPRTLSQLLGCSPATPPPGLPLAHKDCQVERGTPSLPWRAERAPESLLAGGGAPRCLDLGAVVTASWGAGAGHHLPGQPLTRSPTSPRRPWGPGRPGSPMLPFRPYGQSSCRSAPMGTRPGSLSCQPIRVHCPGLVCWSLHQAQTPAPTSPTWKPRTPGAPGGPCGPRAP